MEFIEDSIDATEKKRSQEGALFQLSKDLLSVERSTCKPAQDEIDAGVHNLVGAWWELYVKGEFRKVSENEGHKNP